MSGSRGTKLLGFLAIVAVVVYGVFLFVPQSVPLLDANREILAESQKEGFCAGVVFGTTRGYGSYEQMNECMAEDGRSPEKNLDLVQESFCVGFNRETGYSVDDCMAAVSEQKIWPTIQGTITTSWNRSFPYPGGTALDAGTQDDSRTGGRITNDRIGESRP